MISIVGDSGDDIILSGDGDDDNIGDTIPFFGDGSGSGDDIIPSGDGNDMNAGIGGDVQIVGGDGDDH